MRRLLIPLLTGCLLLGSSAAHARYGVRPPSPRPDGVVDTWAVIGDRVVGRFQISDTGSPTMHLSIAPGGKRVVAWRVKNVQRAPSIKMTSTCDSGPRVTFRFVTPTGVRVTGLVTHDGFYARHVDPGTFHTVYVHVHVKRGGFDRTCELRGDGYGHGYDRVLLEVEG